MGLEENRRHCPKEHSLASDTYNSRAHTMLERIQALQTHGAFAQVSPYDLEQAESKLKCWQTELPFNQPQLFKQKLERIGVDEESFCQALALPTENLEQLKSTPPHWRVVFDEAYRDFGRAPAVFQTDENAPVDFASQLSPVNPLVAWGLFHLRQSVNEMIKCPECGGYFDLELIEQAWLVAIRGPLARMLARVTALELGIARVENRLTGRSPADRYKHFFDGLRTPEHALAMWGEYPVLARQVAEFIATSLDALREFLEHLRDDWRALESTFAENQLGSLTGLTLGQGDSHAGGRGVIVAAFVSGERIVYKPRPLGVEIHFQELLTWLNEHGAEPQFRTLRVLDRVDHGWVEFVQQAECADQRQMERFFLRQGGLTALFYALHANDLHSQNLIACGEHPVAIDLETLFHPLPVRRDTHPIDRLLHTAYEESVMKTGLLPQRIWSNGGSEGVDISGIGGGGCQLAPAMTLCWEEPGTDQMRVIRDHFEMAPEKNRPVLDKDHASPYEYRQSIQTGFAATYRLLLQNRDELNAPGGPLSWFTADHVRVILRDTRTYAVLLDESFHPDYLQDAIDRDRLFDRLWLRAVHQPHLARVIDSEQYDLARRDIPVFHTNPDSCDLFNSRGDRIADFFDSSGLETARRRLEQLSEEDLSRQLWFVETSLATLRHGQKLVRARPTRPVPLGTPSNEQLIEAATQVADRLEQLAVRDGSHSAWFGANYLNDGWSVDISGLDLYDGLSGIALFLAYLGNLTGDGQHAELAQSTVNTLEAFLREDYQPKGIGGFSGLGGLLYSLSHLASIWDRPDLLDLAELLAQRNASMIQGDDQFDIVSGSAGFLSGLLSVESVRHSDATLELAKCCGEHLLQAARRDGSIASWTANRVSDRPLAGFSHGAGGIAHALIALHRKVGDDRLFRTALAAMEFERTLYSPQHQNWSDQRPSSDRHAGQEHGMMTAWCHGSPGVGLSRLIVLDFWDDPRIKNEIVAAVNSTLASGFGGNHSLCHGDIGNLIFLQSAASTLEDSRLEDRVSQIKAEVLASIHRDGYACGIPLPTQTPGLMNGLAGIGYGLLRLAAPRRIPNVLALEPPR